MTSALENTFFKVAVILRNSHLVSSLLTNAEAWYNVTQADIDLLESVDESLLRRVLECPHFFIIGVRDSPHQVHNQNEKIKFSPVYPSRG
jgi:hypothetical protein